MPHIAHNPGDSVRITTSDLPTSQVEAYVIKDLNLKDFVVPISISYCGPEEHRFDQEKKKSVPTGVHPIILGTDNKSDAYTICIDDFLECFVQQRKETSGSYLFMGKLNDSKSRYLFIAKSCCEFIPAPPRLITGKAPGQTA